MERPAILQEREKTHGSFRMTATTAQELKVHFRTLSNFSFSKLPARQREALDMFATKIARILSGDHSARDHWDDIAGYAQLGAEACQDQ